MKIKVTQDNIDCGHRGNSAECPIALAFKSQTSKEEVCVDYDAIFFDEDKCLLLPLEATNFIHNFDNGEEVAPFEFEINDN